MNDFLLIFQFATSFGILKQFAFKTNKCIALPLKEREYVT